MNIRKKTWATVMIMSLAIFFLLWGGYYLIDRVPAFHVVKVTVTGEDRCDRQAIEEIVSDAYGKCILKVDLPDLHQKIRSIGWVKSVSIRRVLPNMIDITIKERVPYGILQAEQQYLVDREGVVIAPVQDQKAWDLPVISGLSMEKPLISREIESPSLKSALKLLGLMQDLKAGWFTEVTEISLENPENIVLYNKNRGREIRMGHNNLQEKVLYLHTIWNDIKARVSGIEYIDLRYKNQIIVKPEKRIS